MFQCLIVFRMIRIHRVSYFPESAPCLCGSGTRYAECWLTRPAYS